MQITQITVSYSRTESLPDYCNVRPSITLTADVHEGDDLESIESELHTIAREIIYDQVDAAREQANLSPKFYRGELHWLYINHSRQCMVIVSKSANLPRTPNWKYDDRWVSLTSEARPSFALGTAVSHKLSTNNYQIFECVDGDFSKIPPVPDAGPAPAFIGKKLGLTLERLNIDPSVWEELGELGHVSREYLQRLFQLDAEQYLASDDLVDLIRHNKPWPPAYEDKADRDMPEDE